MLPAMDCVPYPRFDWNSCHAWPTLHSGRRPARRYSAPRGAFCMPIRQTAGPPSRIVVDADPVAARIRDIMAERTMWSGKASDLLRVGAHPSRYDASRTDVGWPKSPRALAGRLRRVQTPLRALGIDISFGREGRAGARIIRLRASNTMPTHTTVSTVSTVGKGID